MRATKLFVLLTFAAIATLMATKPVRAQDARSEITTDSYIHNGVKANAPIPPELHIRNEGGSNGAGLCVISTSVINGEYQGVPGIAGEGKNSLIWRTAKTRPGGYSDTKLKALIDEVMPGEGYANYLTGDSTILDRLSSQGYPIGATMNTGALYKYKRIAHMITLNHYQSGREACVIDNNDPGNYHWMEAQEFDRRWKDNGIGWAFVWTRKPPTDEETAALIIIAAVGVVIYTSHSRSQLAT